MKNANQKHLWALQQDTLETVDDICRAVIAEDRRKQIAVGVFAAVIRAIDLCDEYLNWPYPCDIPDPDPWRDRGIADGMKLLYQAREDVRALL